MENQIKVSIIMPSLNVRNYIANAVQSAMDQTLREIEIICIDAGSDDGTWEFLSGLAKTDERIILRRSDVRSYGYQVNLGIDMARGEYIAVLETDDYAAPDMYERLYHTAHGQGCDYVKSDCMAYWIQYDGNRFFFKKRTIMPDNLYGKVIKPIEHPIVALEDWYLWSGIYKRDFLLRNNIRLSETPGAAFQDIGFLFQTNVCAKKALYLKEAYYRYCVDREGASSSLGKGLKFSYQEFSRLLESSRIVDKDDPDTLRLLYCRMAKSFTCCYGEVSEGKNNIADDERIKYYAWFKEKLGHAIGKNLLNAQMLHEGIWNKLEFLLVSEDKYIQALRENERSITDKIGKAGEFPLVIFGCGNYGYSAYKWLKEHDYNLVAFMDNNKALWGMKANGITIEPPERVRMLGSSTKYLIANEMHSGEIKAQLMDMGVTDGNIGIYV